MKVFTPALLFCLACWSLAGAAEPASLGGRLELLVDDYLIDRLSGDARLHLHQPRPREVSLVAGEPWEGNTSAYYSIFQDGDLFRMYYRGSHFDESTGKSSHTEVVCYAESADGIHWTKPDLGLFEFQGSRKNNIVWDGIGRHCFTPFKDLNPDCRPDARYKALSAGGSGDVKGLYAFKSADGIRWSLMADEPVITDGAFDSQNLAFWDPHVKVYREYHRDFRKYQGRGVRDIKTGTSSDFLDWTAPVYLTYPGAAADEHLYTNAVRPYDRAPHILIGFPTRFLPGKEQVEPVFMTSRDGRTFRRWKEAVIPRTAPADRDGNRSNYMTWGLLKLPSSPQEYSVYATEAYYTGPDSRVRRFTYRVDGFVSLRSSARGGELLTKPFTFEGRRLIVNYATTETGAVAVELMGAGGTPVDGLALEDCVPLNGDSIDHSVTWRSDAEVAALAGKPVRLRFRLKDADLYSFRFAD